MKKAFVYGLLVALAITGCQAELEEVSNNEKKIEQTDDDIKEKNENKCQEKKVEAVNIEKNNKDKSKNDIIIED